jgi:osmotically-inducible protein OsmY
MDFTRNSKMVSTDGDADPILAGVVRSLRSSGYPDLFGLQCRCKDGVITLAGQVGSYYLKQLAQTAARRVPGVTSVDNQLLVS